MSSKGQITLPAPVREKLGLVTGTPVRFELRERDVIIRKGAGGPHPVDRVFGRLKLAKPVDVLLDEMRGPGRAGTPASPRQASHGRSARCRSTACPEGLLAPVDLADLRSFRDRLVEALQRLAFPR